MLPTPPPSPQLKGTGSTPDNLVGHVLPGTAIELQGVLGIGAYGTVYVARDLHSGISFAVKALNKVGLTARQTSFLEREIRLHRRASSHPNVVTLVDVVETSQTTFVVLEYCPEGDLFGNITEQSRYVGNDQLAKRIFLQLLDAVEYCHSIGVYHRDIKPENILITDGGMTAKLADFGLACTESCSSDFGCGSTFYMSPECLQSPVAFSCYSSAANDVWALGICLINLTCGRNPWRKASVSDATFSAYLLDSAFLPTILPLSHDLDWILRRIFECDPKQRVQIPELRRMIAQCPRFTVSSSPDVVPQPAAECIPPYALPSSEVIIDHTNAALNNPNVLLAAGTTPQHYSPASTTSTSDDWLYPAPISPLSLSPASTNSYPHSDYAMDIMMAGQMQALSQQQQQQQSQQQQQPHYLSVPSPSAWYSAIMAPAFDLAQKHLSFHPTVFPGMRFA